MRPVAYGGPDVPAIVKAPVPNAQPGHVVVKVEAAGANPIDWKLYSSEFQALYRVQENAAATRAASLPSLGFECAGVIAATGVDVTDVGIGDEVIVHPVTGAYADYVAAPISALTLKPTSLGWQEAGALMLAGPPQHTPYTPPEYVLVKRS